MKDQSNLCKKFNAFPAGLDICFPNILDMWEFGLLYCYIHWAIYSPILPGPQWLSPQAGLHREYHVESWASHTQERVTIVRAWSEMLWTYCVLNSSLLALFKDHFPGMEIKEEILNHRRDQTGWSLRSHLMLSFYYFILKLHLIDFMPDTKINFQT